MTADGTSGAPGSGAEAGARAAATGMKRFYTAAAAGGLPDGGFAILLDGRQVRTPARSVLRLDSKALAAAIAEEWQRQGEFVVPASMPLTKLANTALDGVVGKEAAVAADIAAFAGSDLVCYRAEHPAELVADQAAYWDPALAWAEEELGVLLVTTKGVMPVAQSAASIAAMRQALSRCDALELVALHVMTTLTGSAVLAMAVAAGRFGVADAWAAAHVDEDHQIRHWGEDTEAAERRERRWQEMQAAHRFLVLHKQV
ncbi:MAG: ATP12 family protein [Hyphomicrobiaceae bacterium]|nr:ATP12 family protein [Hyphomicrobiaceae bacterium]